MRLLDKIANTDYVQKAIKDQADLTELKKRPAGRVLFGLFLIAFSYVIGWPAVIALGAVAISLEKPLIVVIGGPLTYGLSHLVFILGAYFAGANYSKIFARWATRIIFEKLNTQSKPTEE
jgi:hypothetical protein